MTLARQHLPDQSADQDQNYERVDTESLGRATWTFLHTLAAAHPAVPSAAETARAARFMRDFAAVYPCAPCAESFREIVDRRPVDAASGPRFARWMCEAHNDVNRELGKDVFPCDPESLAQRWGTCEACSAHAGELDAFQKMALPGFAFRDHPSRAKADATSGREGARTT
jgi:mitochondrial FAD-linked sulfhydryl oxidase